MTLDAGAVKALSRDGKSLLPIGVVRGDRRVRARRGGGVRRRRRPRSRARPGQLLVGRGAPHHARPSSEIEAVLGYVDEPELIHRDNLVAALATGRAGPLLDVRPADARRCAGRRRPRRRSGSGRGAGRRTGAPGRAARCRGAALDRLPVAAARPQLPPRRADRVEAVHVGAAQALEAHVLDAARAARHAARSAPPSLVATCSELRSTKKRKLGRRGRRRTRSGSRARGKAGGVTRVRRRVAAVPSCPGCSRSQSLTSCGRAAAAGEQRRAAATAARFKPGRRRARRAISGADLQARAVGRVVDARSTARRRARSARAHGGVELEAQEVHRRGLLLVLALEVLVGDGVDARRARRPAPRRGARRPSAAPACAGARRRRDTRSAWSPSSCRRRGSAGCRRRARPGCRPPRRCARCAASPGSGSGSAARPRTAA